MTRRERAIERAEAARVSQFQSGDMYARGYVAGVDATLAELTADLESDETVERVARALYEAPAYGNDERHAQTPWAESDWGHQEFDREQWRIRARAALRSVLEG